MHVLVVTDNFVPERNAPAKRTYEHCQRWVKAGVQVTVVTSAPNFPSGTLMAPYRNRLFQRERQDGIEIIRVWTYLAPNTAVVRRSLDFASFGVMSFLAGLFQQDRRDRGYLRHNLAGLSWAAARCGGKAPSVAGGARSVARLDRGSNMREKHPAVRLLRLVEGMFHRSAARIVTTNEGLRAAAGGVPPEKIGVVPNSVDPVEFSPRPRPPELVDKYGLNGRFVVGHGTQGIAHDFESMLEAALALKDTDVSFLLVGEGAQHLALTRRVKALKLDNVRFVRPVPHSDVPDHIACCDVLLVPMKRTAMLNDTMPSKRFSRSPRWSVRS